MVCPQRFQEPAEREEDVPRETEPTKSLEEERRQQFMQAKGMGWRFFFHVFFPWGFDGILMEV